MSKKGKNTTEKNKQLFLTALEKVLGNISQASESTNIPRRTVYNWIRDDEDFAEKVSSISEKAIDYVESKLFKLIKEDNPSAIFFFLKCKAKHRGYVERQELTGSDGKEPVKIELVMPDNNRARKDEEG